MFISKEEKEHIIRELELELHAKMDGGRKNLIVERCPYCGKGGGRFGIYIGKETEKKKLFMSHCFKCGHTTTDPNQLFDDIGRPDLKIEEHITFTPVQIPEFFNLDEEEVDDELVVVDMPESWKRCYKNGYLKSRGFLVLFPVPLFPRNIYPPSLLAMTEACTIMVSYCTVQKVYINITALLTANSASLSEL